jgi:hypothetical protein
MNDLMVQIMLHGLIALAPPADGQLNHMTALLVDARVKTTDLCSEKHWPQLTVVTSNPECEAADCTVSGQECICTLALEEITLTPDAQPDVDPISWQRPASLPFSRTKAMDFSYIVNLAADPFNQKLDSRFLDPVPPSGLVARMTFPFEDVHACALAVRPDEGGDNVLPMSFRPMGQTEKEEDRNQAIAQMLMIHYMLPEGQPITPLKITLKKFDGSGTRSMTLIPGATGYFIQLENSRSILPVDHPCDDGIGRDFDLLYKLAENPPAPADRKIPHFKYTRWKSSAELFNDECQSPKDVMSRPVCPIGSFYP